MGSFCTIVLYSFDKMSLFRTINKSQSISKQGMIMLSIKKTCQANSFLNKNYSSIIIIIIVKLHFSCFYVLGEFVRFLAVLRTI